MFFRKLISKSVMCAKVGEAKVLKNRFCARSVVQKCTLWGVGGTKASPCKNASVLPFLWSLFLRASWDGVSHRSMDFSCDCTICANCDSSQQVTVKRTVRDTLNLEDNHTRTRHARALDKNDGVVCHKMPRCLDLVIVCHPSLALSVFS